MNIASTAIAEKMSAVKTYDYLEARSKKGSFKHLRKLLDKVPNKNRKLLTFVDLEKLKKIF